MSLRSCRASRRRQGERATLTIFGDRLAWRVLVRADPTHVYDTVVDATTGETLYRVNLVREATARAFDNYPGAPIGGAQVDKVFSETGADPWLTAADRLAGDNAHVYADPDDAIDGFPPADPSPQPADEIPPSAPGAWNYAQDARSRHLGPALPIGRLHLEPLWRGTSAGRSTRPRRQPSSSTS